MKKLLLAIICLIIGGMAFAQAPQKISYQAVIRNNNGNLVTNQQVSLRISIMKNGGTTGQIDQPIVNRSIVAIYTETHTVTTNANGLATIEIGGGTTSDNFAAIDWSNGTYYLKTSVDLTGRGRYEVMGMSQLISVPYAMYAQKAGSAVTETDPQFNAWDKDYNDLTNRPEIPVVPTNVSAFENDANYITSADVPAQVNADWNAMSGAGQILNKPAIPTVPTNVSAFTNDANYITSADVPAQVNADWNATSGAGQILNKPEIPTVPTNVSAFTNDANYITSADVPAQVNADWNATSGAGQILNKPEIPTVPTNVSAFTNDANYITSADVPAQVNADWNATSGAGQILNKPELFSGNYNDLTNKPEIPTVPTNVSAFTNDANYITSADVPTQVNADWNATSGAGQILNKPELFSGNYNDLANRPEIPTVPTNVSAFTNDANYITTADVPAQVNADWNATSGAGQILNKPTIPTVPNNVSAFANDANYITSADVPAQVNADWNATSGAGQILNKPELFSGDYNDLANRPEIPTVPTNVSAFTNDANYITSADVPAQVNADWNATSGAGQILNKPELFSGDYNDLANRPEIPTIPTNVSAFANDANYITSADVPAQVNADWNATSGAGQILNKPELFSGDYNDLANKPEIPTVPTNISAFTNDANYITSADVPAQVNADWNATNGAGQILNKPELFSGDYNDLANKPTIPTVPTNVSAFANDANYITSADVPAQVNADWNATSGAGQILNKPELFDGNYNNLTNTPDLSGYVTTESQTLTDVAVLGNSMGDRQIKNVADPTENQDAVTKKYVDELIAALQAQNAALQAQIAEMQATIDALSTTQGSGNVTYTITYNANGGTGTMNPQTFNAGEEQTLTSNTFTRENYNFAGWNTIANGNGTAYTNGQSITISENITLYAQWEIATSGTLGGHYWIDLGLPSGTLWANCNVGASNPEDYGNYYIWGETTAYSGGSATYNSNPTVLPSSADAAAVNWGEEWRMPTKAEMQELIDNCTIISTTQNGVSGRLVTGPNGNTIFIPGAGYRYMTISQGGTNAYYMSSSTASSGSSPSTIWVLIIDSNGARMNSSTRAGYSVRPVCPSTAIAGSSNPSQPTSYTITFDANGGTGTMNSQTFTAGTAQAITTNTFTKENYTFTGWNTAADGSGTAYTDGQSIIVSESMTLYAQWEESPNGRFTDTRDGNTYNYVTIGNQIWMAENLRYEGDIALGTASSSTKKYRYYPNGSSSNVTNYSYLYNRTAAMNGASSSSTNPSNVQGICPVGWHLPSNAEWNQLVNYLSSHGEYQCRETASYIAKSLASKTGWDSSTEICAVGNNQMDNNSTGFCAVPAGEYNNDGNYLWFGSYSGFWTTDYDSSRDSFLGRYLYSNNAIIAYSYVGAGVALSIRCVKNN